MLVATVPSCLVVVTICVKTLGDAEGAVADLYSQQNFARKFHHSLDCVDVLEEAVDTEAGAKAAMVGTMSLASNSTRSNSKSKFPAPPLLVIMTVCQLVLSIVLD